MLYSAEDKTLTALGDVVRTKKGLDNLEASINNQNWQYTSLETIQLNPKVKKIKIIGTGTYHNKGSFYLGLAVAPGVYDSMYNAEKDSNKVILQAGSTSVDNLTFNFEAVLEGNSCSFIASPISNGTVGFVLNLKVIGLDENGKEYKYTLEQMVQEVDNLISVSEDALVITGDAGFRFYKDGLNKSPLKSLKDKITTKNLTNIQEIFRESTTLTEIPFEINMSEGTGYHECDYAFYYCNQLSEIPKINYLAPVGGTSLFQNVNIKEIPESVYENWDWSYLDTDRLAGVSQAYKGRWVNIISFISVLEKIPDGLIYHPKNPNFTYSSYISCGYNNMFKRCQNLREINNIYVYPQEMDQNRYFMDGAFVEIGRAKSVAFVNGQTARWSGITMDLSQYVGFYYVSSYFNTPCYVVTSDEAYQKYKNNPDWVATKQEYSRYNHDSAVETINSLPDCSEYVAEKGATNTIKFNGNSGSKTDGGAINTLTEEEIAVATAKGWSVTFV